MRGSVRRSLRLSRPEVAGVLAEGVVAEAVGSHGRSRHVLQCCIGRTWSWTGRREGGREKMTPNFWTTPRVSIWATLWCRLL